ncbi:MAG: peptide MFS transporter [Gammaproteobacteria bacterium]
MELHHPKPLWALAFGKLWDTFSYYGTLTILTLYLIHVFHLAQGNSYSIYGAYAALAYSMPILGGIVADRWIGCRNALITGCVLNIVGNLMLVSFHRYFFCLGLATTLLGTGLYKGNALHLAGNLYPSGHDKKESGFTWIYVSINVGGMLGPLVYGFIVTYWGWNYGFLCSALGITVGFIWLLLNLHTLEAYDKKLVHTNSTVYTSIYISILLLIILISLPFYYYTQINFVIFVAFLVALLYIFASICRHHSEARKRLTALIVFCFLAMFYFMAGLQTGATVTLFIQHKIQEGVIHTSLPASTFNTLYCLCVIVLAPLFVYLWKCLKRRNVVLLAPQKLVVGIVLALFGITMFYVASVTSFVLLSIFLGYFLLSAGEVAIAPSAYTLISDLAPIGMKGTMMGSWLLFIAMGGYLSSVLARLSHAIATFLPWHFAAFSGEFLVIDGFVLVTVILTVLVNKGFLQKAISSLV